MKHIFRFITILCLLLFIAIPISAQDRVRKVSHYVVLPTTLSSTPIPMARFKYKIKDAEGVETGEESNYTPDELYPNAVRNADGTKLIIGMELTNIMEAINEFQHNFQHGAELQVLSHSEALELMRTPEWEPYVETVEEEVIEPSE